jgi:hypothetical protein
MDRTLRGSLGRKNGDRSTAVAFLLATGVAILEIDGMLLGRSVPYLMTHRDLSSLLS